jgi:TonB-linked SusC/RagA family outer membrane protein
MVINGLDLSQHTYFINKKDSKMRKCLVLTILLTAFAYMSHAQSKEVTGKVTDSSGSPIAGASINIKGIRKGTSAGPDGSFRIMAPDNGTLVVTAIGYSPREINIGGQSEITVQIYRDTRAMSEVVVTALGIRREKRSLGYSTQTIGSDELNKTGTSNPLNELSGKASGLTVINSAGDPGAGTFVLLRGVTSITGNNQPLMVVDGVPIDNSANNFDPQFNGFQAGGAGAQLLGAAQPTNRGIDLNPNDIESITLLKGPAATALYGIQAASGAIVITTKRGGGRKAQVTFNSSVTVDRHTHLPGLQNQFAQGDFDDQSGQYVYLGPATGQAFSWGPAIDTLSWDGATDNPWDKHGNIVGRSDPSAKTPVHAYDPYSFFKSGMVLDNNIAVSGGTADAGYRMSYGNLYQTGIIPKTRYAKNTFALSGQIRASSKLTLQGSITYVSSSNDKAQQGSNLAGIMLGLLRTTPTFDNSNGLKNAYNNPDAYLFPNGQQRSYRGFGIYDNPYYTINRNPTTSNLSRVLGYGQVNFQANDWLGFSYRLGGDIYTQSDKSAFGSQSGPYGDNNGALFLTTYGNQQFNSDFTVNMKHSFGDLNASLLLGHNYFDLQNNNRLVKAVGLLVSDFNDASNAVAPVTTQFDGHKRTQAYYADLELNWHSMLYLSVTGRREETSTLSPANNTFFYPSASLGWVFTELGSLKGRDVLNYGKVRVNYAQVGKDAPIYALTTLYSAPFAFTDGFVNTGVSIPGYFLSSNVASIGNPNLKTEKTRSYEAGLDLNLYKDRITFNGTYYYSKSSDVIVPVSISYTTGFAGELLNAATITNKGVELTLNTNPVRTSYGLRWDVNFNWSKNTNKVVALAPGLDRLLLSGFGAGEFEVDAVVGKPYGVLYGNTTPHSNLTDLKSPLLINDDPAAGAGYGQPLGGGVGPNQVIGNPNPKWLGSVQSNLSYKGFTLGVQVNIKHGGDIMNGTRGALALRGTAIETANRGQATVFKGVLGHLDEEGNVVHFEGTGTDPKPGPGAVNTIQSHYDYNYWTGAGNSVTGGQEVDIQDGGYTKIRQVSLTYELPKTLATKMSFTALSLTVFANNLHTWTKYDGVDPETSLSGPANGQGMDFFNNPGIKNYGVRLNVGF